MSQETPRDFLKQLSGLAIKVEASPGVLSGAAELFKSCDYLGADDLEKVGTALFFAHTAHRYFSLPPERAQRADGKEYTTHLIETAKILAAQKCDLTTIQAALLHDTLENTSATREILATSFGIEVADTVDTVTKVAGSTAETMIKVLQGLKDQPRAVLIKLADRLHNMRTIDYLPKAKRQRIAEQTLQVFAPLARELGLYDISDALFDLSIKVKWRDQYHRATGIINERYKKKEAELLFLPIKSAILSSADISPDIDINVLEPAVHNFFDFSKSSPRVVDRNEIPVEIDCRTEESFRETVAYFQRLYPEINLENNIEDGTLKLKFPMGGRNFSVDIFNPAGYLRKRSSLVTLFRVIAPEAGLIKQAQEKLSKPVLLLEQVEEKGYAAILRYFSEAIKYPLITVETPDGDIKVLPEGSAVLDFAFSISHDLGLRAVSATINGREVKLEQKLNSGDKVEIKSGDKWTVSVGMLDQVFYEGYRRTLRRALKLILRLNGERLNLAPKSRTYGKNLEIMGFEENDLHSATTKILRDAENRGEKLLLELYRRITRKPLNIDLIRGWKEGEFHDRNRRSYKNYIDFVTACGLDDVDSHVLEAYIKSVETYDSELPVLTYDLPDRRAVLAMMTTIASTGANIVGVGLEYNLTDIPAGYVRLQLKIEINGNNKEEKRRSLKSVLKDAADAILSQNFRPNERELINLEINIPLPDNVDPLPFVALFSSFGLNVMRLERSNDQATFTVNEFKKGPVEVDQLELIMEALDEIKRAISSS